MANAVNDRIVVLIDMDCFFCQVETKLQPEYVGKPLAVVQYNQWQLGGIIAVNYEARDYGVTRHMRGEEAKEKCPNIVLASVPCLRGKADTSRYRSAGREVVDVIRKHCNIIERASVDEAYLDISDIVDKRMSTTSTSVDDLSTLLSNTFVVGYSDVGKNDEKERSKGTMDWLKRVFQETEDVQSRRFAIAGLIVEELRADIFNKTGFRCSAGISQNKILTKLACGLHKPNRQTILPASSVSSLYSKLPIKKVRNLGGKFGDVITESLNCNVMGDLLQYSLQYLQKRFDDKTGLWLYNIARGIDNEPVTIRLVSKSIGACKKFPGRQAIKSLEVLTHWAGELSSEICERLEQDTEENERRATLGTVSFHYYQNRTTITQSKSFTLNSYKPEKLASRCVDIITKSTQCPIAYLGISVGKFIPAKGSEHFKNYFKSNNLGKCKEDNDFSKSMEINPAPSVNNSMETMKDNLQLNTIDNMTSCKNNVNSVINEQEETNLNFKINANLSEDISNTTKTGDSPTSRKLSSLIKSLNERNKRKHCEKKSITSNLSDMLEQNDFKQSFFMNILNCVDQKETNVNQSNLELVELNDGKKINSKCEDLNHLQKVEENNSNEIISVNQDECDFKVVTNNETDTETISSDVRTENRNNVKLKEIFPDLNNIDPNIVALLPSDLQKEAKMYMNVENKKQNGKEVLTKTTKGKGKQRTNAAKGKKSNDISSFLVKRNTTSNSTEILHEQCLQCYQMIPVFRFQEHCDFHVAENLQRELNPISNALSVKRKNDSNKADTNSLKRRPNADILKVDKPSKSITSFFT